MTAQNHVVTLIANPAVEPLASGLVTDLQKRLKTKAEEVELQWLAEKEACEIFCKTEQPGPLRIEMKTALAGKPFDGAVLPMRQRRKKLLISDMDSTMIRQECIDELADFAGIKDQVSAITEAAMRGELEFKGALEKRVALLQGMRAEVLERVYRERIEPMPGAKTLVATMKANGARAVLVSGGFTFFTERVAAALGFDGQMANVLEIEDGHLTGRVVPPILDKESKRTTLEKVADSLGLPLAHTLAVGDGANDLPMIEAAGLGVAYHGKEIVRKGADAAISHGDLTALLYLQGYRKDEFVTG